MEILGNILLLLGAFVAFSGALGVLRMPDFYSRLHPAGTTDTAGQTATAEPEGWIEKSLALVDKFASRFFPTPPEE